ncbi:MAG: hypothetical protein OEV57_08705 [Dehalococcoidia bacterium]|nr:hypothetical protein [Dehalococcoidia bacterium]
MMSLSTNCGLLLLNGDGGAPCSWRRSFWHILPLRQCLSVVDYPGCHTVLLLVFGDAEAVDYENGSAS